MYHKRKPMNDRGQAGTLFNAAIGFIMFLVLGIILATAADVNQSFVDGSTAGSASRNVSTNVGEGLQDVGDQMPNVGTVLVAVLIITLLLGIFTVVGRLRG